MSWVPCCICIAAVCRPDVVAWRRQLLPAGATVQFARLSSLLPCPTCRRYFVNRYFVNPRVPVTASRGCPPGSRTTWRPSSGCGTCSQSRRAPSLTCSRWPEAPRFKQTDCSSFHCSPCFLDVLLLSRFMTVVCQTNSTQTTEQVEQGSGRCRCRPAQHPLGRPAPAPGPQAAAVVPTLSRRLLCCQCSQVPQARVCR